MNISRIINQKLLAELRKLGIRCPVETQDVIRISTEYHAFTIYSPHTKLKVSEISPPREDWPARQSAMVGLIDAGPKEFEISNPEFFKEALEFIIKRWEAIERFEDIKTIDYIETHSQSERALFNKSDINRMLKLAGYPPDMDLEYISLPYHKAIKYINKARVYLQSPNHPAIVSTKSEPHKIAM